MSRLRRSNRGFSLVELMFTVAFAATLMAIAVPVMTDVSDTSKLNGAARELERELQSARMKSVSANRLLRVRLNCPSAGQYRTVEYLGDNRDQATNRCAATAYPFPADNNVMTTPNYDGPIRLVPHGATMSTNVIEFHPDGTAYTVVSNVVATIPTSVSLTVTRKSRTKAITINGAGKIQLQ